MINQKTQKSSVQTLYLNIGAGDAKLSGFINIDRKRGADIRRDVTRGLPFADEAVDGIYCEHFIEHLKQTEILRFLRECRRVLKPGGRIRIATPDLDELIHQYCTNSWRQPWIQKYGYEWIGSRAEFLNVNFREWGHQWILNEEELSRLARWAGLGAPIRSQLNVSEDPALCSLETRPESTLIMEFKKSEHRVAESSLVSIVIPAFRPDFFRACLTSALSQTYTNTEILVLDDSPSNAIKEIVEEYAEDDARILYWKNSPALGEANNLTKGIRLARGEFVKPLYDDDVLEKHAVNTLVSALMACPGARMAACNRTLIGADGERVKNSRLFTPLSKVGGRISGGVVVSEILSAGVNLLGIPTCMLFWRADALGIEEENIMTLFGRIYYGIGDVCLATHLLAKGDLAYVAEPLTRIRIHSGQTQNQLNANGTALVSWAYLRRQGLRLGFNIGKGSLLIDKLIKKNSKAQVVMKAYRFMFLIKRWMGFGLH